MNIAVVGAGIMGLSIGYELDRAGADVTCFESDEPMGGRSIGDTRIFRVLHADPRLVSAARAAQSGWQRWSETADIELVGHEGLVVSGAAVEKYSGVLDSDAALERHEAPFGVVPGRLTGPCLFDPEAGVIKVQETGRFLADASHAALRRLAVVSLVTHPTHVELQLGDGSQASFDQVVVAAGAGTRSLLRDVGQPLDERVVRHSRFTFRMKEDLPAANCWIGDDATWRDGFSFYSHRTSVGYWAIGGHLDDNDTSEDLSVVEVQRRSANVVADYVRERMPDLLPAIVDVINCDHPVVSGGDGFAISHPHDLVRAVWGHNLFKMAPFIGETIAAMVGGKHAQDELHLFAAR